VSCTPSVETELFMILLWALGAGRAALFSS
jgi:hypothetical protein